MSVQTPTPPAGFERGPEQPSRTEPRRERLGPYLLVGVYLGIVFTKSEVISWFRIQEMFRFQAFHMYGIIGSAVIVAAISVALIQRLGIGSVTGRPLRIPRQPWTWPGYQFWIRGTLFGLGWALTGACPGPLYVLIGSGLSVMVAALAAAIAGVWTYGLVRHRIRHS